MNKYLWTEDAHTTAYPTLDKDESADVLIIGGGMAGILCARFLQDAGVKCLLCESNRIGSGTTRGTTAVITPQHSQLYTKLESKFGIEKAKMYLHANLNALKKYEEMCKNIDCDYENTPSYIFSDNTPLMEKEVGALNSMNYPAGLVYDLPIPMSFGAAVKFETAAQFHPLKFLYAAAQGLNIREHTPIIRVENGAAYTADYKITAEKIIVASHFPIMNTHGMYFLKLYQKRSYVVALENAPHYDGTYVEDKSDGLYFRNYKNLLIVGGGDHRTGKSGGGFDAVRRFVSEKYPDATEKYHWAAQDCMSLDSVPYIGRYSRRTPNIYVASGFNEWGMTGSMAAAQLLSDMVLRRPNPNAAVFEPSRSMLSAQLFANLGTTLADFIIPTAKRCPHLGCALRWNKHEHSWDCPCHGSRFEEDGKLIDNPATGGLHPRQ